MTSLVQQKPRKRGGRKGGQKSSLWLQVRDLFIQIPWFFASRARVIWKSYPTAGWTIVCGCMAIGLATFVKNSFTRAQQRILPSEVVVQIADARVRERVRLVVKKNMEEAQKKRWTRPQLLTELGQDLNRIETLDEYWLRTGMDHRIQVHATTQIPVLYLEVAGGQSYLIGHKMNVLKDNPKTGESAKILRVSAPEVKLKFTTEQGELLSSRELKTKHLGQAKPSNLNIGWLYRQSRDVQLVLASMRLNYWLSEIVWRQTTGFALVLKRIEEGSSSAGSGLAVTENKTTPGEETQSHGHLAPRVVPTLTVFLGDRHLTKRTKRLERVLNDLAEKKLDPERIDLSFDDKAVIRFAQGYSSATL